MGFFDIFRKKQEGMDINRYFQIAIKQDILGSRIDAVREWWGEIDNEIRLYKEDNEDDMHIEMNVFMLPPDAKRRIINKGISMLYSAAIPWLRIYDNGELTVVIDNFLQTVEECYPNDKLLDLIIHEILLILAKSFSNRDVEPLPPLVIYMPYTEVGPVVPTRTGGLDMISERLKGMQSMEVKNRE